MKKIYNIIMLLALALTGLTLAACGDDDLSTNQYGGGVSLNVYGPQPVMRGGTLRFLGSHLEQIAQVQIPGIDPITNIEVVQSGVPSEIRVVLPKDGPEPGYVTLVTKTDQKITTTTKLTYEEPIEITKFTPETVMPGDELTIEGDYLNLVQMVEFADGIQVSQDNFTEHTRYAIKVVVPEQARTGKLNLYTLDLTKDENNAGDLTYNILETENALTVGTPTVTKFSSPRGEAEATGTVTAKAGETITVTGKNFNLVDAVAFGDGDNIVTTKDINISEDGTTLTFKLPAEAPDGDINLVARSGVEIAVGQLTTVTPSNLVAAPNPVKAGQQLVITGKDLDLVTSITMPGVSDAVKFTTSATKLIIESVPETATEGNDTLHMTNGKSVEVSVKLVKPVVTGYDNSAVNAGGALVLKGTNLDLVKTVTFGEAAVDVKASADGTSISLTVPMEAKNGKPVLKLANGTKIDAPELEIKEAVFCYATSLPGEDADLKAGTSFTLPVSNMDRLTGVQINGENCQYVQSGSNLIIGIPKTAGPDSKLRLISSNGEVTYTINFKSGTKIVKTVWSGNIALGWGDGTRVLVPASEFKGVPAGATLTLCYTQKDQTWGQIQVNYGDWKGINFTDGEYKFNQELVPTAIYGWFKDGILDRQTPLVLTQDILDNIQSKQGEAEKQSGIGIIIQGQELTFTKIIVTYIE